MIKRAPYYISEAIEKVNRVTGLMPGGWEVARLEVSAGSPFVAYQSGQSTVAVTWKPKGFRVVFIRDMRAVPETYEVSDTNELAEQISQLTQLTQEV